MPVARWFFAPRRGVIRCDSAGVAVPVPGGGSDRPLVENPWAGGRAECAYCARSPRRSAKGWTLDALVEQVCEHPAGRTREDDLTLVMVERCEEQA